MRRRSELDTSQLSNSVFAGGGEMGALMRAFDWSQTPLGPVENWSPALRMMTKVLLANRFPMLLWWGPDFLQLYNDAYAPVLGDKHPQAALARPFRECWSEVFHILGPLAQTPYEGGPATWVEDILCEVNRYGFTEETHFTIAYSPVPDDTAPRGIGGVLATVHEITEKVVGERRVAALRDLGTYPTEARTMEQACAAAAATLANHDRDVPFALLYLIDKSGTSAHLAGTAGIGDCNQLAPQQLDLRSGNDAIWPLAACKQEEKVVLVEDLREKFARIPAGPWSDPPSSAAVVPIKSNLAHRLAGFLVAGISPRLRFDNAYRAFLELASAQVSTAVANARAYEEERQRAEALAELDRAKTAFFCNVSHEFRTPLTLMLGPLEDVMPEVRERLSPESQEQLINAWRNALRLLKLVNTLLDFSRIEARRVQAVYQPTDLSRLTSDIASVFRSAMERAGLRFRVECERCDEPVYVDRDMWEKVVLNLLSNAFKFTFEGEVALTLKSVDGSVELAVRDTGVGIPDEERGRVFERFHRIKNTRARTYEGTGIGLALVQELIRLHGGNVRVDSAPGKGSTFTVSIPRGHAHLPADRIQAARERAYTALPADAYVDEAERWLPVESGAAAPEPVATSLPSMAEALSAGVASPRETVLIADDNADMRAYLTHLLRNHYRIHAVNDGLQAVEAARELRPDLLLADVMMPGLDGFGVLRVLRDDPALRDTPVILLSARAGEESRVEGLEAGADDYLVKPFTARELLARVATHVKMANLRRENDRRRRLYDTILSNTPDLAYVFDLNHRFIYANEALLTMWGKTWEEASGKNCLELGYEPWHAVMHDREIEQVIATKLPIRGEVPFTGTSGRRIYDYIFVPVIGPNGEVEAIAGTTRDVTDRTQAEDALRRSEERMRAFVAASANMVYSMNADWSEMRHLQGKSFIADTAQAERDWLNKYIYPEDQPRVTAAIAEAIRTRSIFELEHRVLRVDGSLGWSASRAVPRFGSDGEVVEWFGTAADITERKRSEEALLRSEKLATAGRLAATIAHEINNPLEAITNLLYLAQNATTHQEIRDYLEVADQELMRVSQLTRQTLGFYRETEVSSKVRVGSIVVSLLSAFASRARNKSIATWPEIKDDPEICAIPGELRQLIANLISNSIAAVDKGGRLRIRVKPATTRDSARTEGVRLTIADNGQGIPDAIRSQLFEPFVTGNKDVGTGLGLWVCKTVVEKHSGTIQVKSSTTPGKSWTVFSIFLPTNAQSANVPEPLKVAV